MKKKSRPGAVPRIQQTGRRDSPPPADDELFGRVASILEQARTNVVRAVNHNMVVAYWLIGREIVMELQRGQERAGYGEEMLKLLSWRLTQQFGAGYSPTNLRNFRFFYLAYSELDAQIQHTACAKFVKQLDSPATSAGILPDLSPQLSWSQYRILMRVKESAARKYYERESVAGSWSVKTLERQIHTHSYERLVATQIRRGARTVTDVLPVDLAPKRVPGTDSSPPPISAPPPPNPLDSLKDPYVLEFLDIPDPAALHENGLEGAIIAHLRDFLLELGKGFAFVARQKRLSFDGDDLYVDLVFYSIPLR